MEITLSPAVITDLAMAFAALHAATANSKSESEAFAAVDRHNLPALNAVLPSAVMLTIGNLAPYISAYSLDDTDHMTVDLILPKPCAASPMAIRRQLETVVALRLLWLSYNDHDAIRTIGDETRQELQNLAALLRGKASGTITPVWL